MPVPLEDRFDLAQRQLWLFAIRDHESIPRERSHSRKLLAKPELEKADDGIMTEFATLADLLGVESMAISRLKSQTPIERLQACVHPLRKDGNLVRRSGIPYTHTYEKDKELLFLPSLHRHTLNEDFTSFFVLKSFYFAFFGTEIGESNSFEFTPSILEELNTPMQDGFAKTASAANKVNQLSQEDPAIQTSNKRKRDLMDERNERRKARQITNPHLIRTRSDLVTISFQIFGDGQLETLHEETVDPSDPLAVEEAARAYMQKGLRPWSTDLKPLLPGKVFDSATCLGLNTVILLPESNIDIDEPLLEAISQIPLVRLRQKVNTIND